MLTISYETIGFIFLVLVTLFGVVSQLRYMSMVQQIAKITPQIYLAIGLLCSLCIQMLFIVVCIMKMLGNDPLN